MKKILLSFAALMIAAVASAQTDVTFDFSANEWGLPTVTDALYPNDGNVRQDMTKDGAVVVAKYGIGTTSPRMYNNAHLRLYTNNILKVYAPEGKAISKIVFTPDGNYFKLKATGLTEQTWEGNAAAVSFTSTGGASRIKSLVLTYVNMTSETVIPTEADENITIDFTDQSRTEFKGITSSKTFADDLELVDPWENIGTNRVITTITASELTASSKNRLEVMSFFLKLRMFNEKITFKADGDKIIKTIKMTTPMFNSGNKLNGEATTQTAITAGVDINSNTVTLSIAGQTVIEDITIILTDKPITPYSPSTGINNANAEADAAKANIVKKYVEGKQVVIEKNGKKYNVAGAQIK